MLTPKDFFDRMDRLEDNISQRIDRVDATLVEQGNRITALETSAKQPAPIITSPSNTRWTMLGTGVGASIYAIGQYLLTRITSGETK